MEIKTSVNSKLNQIFSAPNQRRWRKEPVMEFEDECVEEEQNKMCWSGFFKKQKSQVIDFQDDFERYWSFSQLFGFNSANSGDILPES